jgi:dihydroxyacetone kinase DhaKLM complex PTS-EIIA-like component DhaM
MTVGIVLISHSAALAAAAAEMAGDTTVIEFRNYTWLSSGSRAGTFALSYFAAARQQKRR